MERDIEGNTGVQEKPLIQKLLGQNDTQKNEILTKPAGKNVVEMNYEKREKRIWCLNSCKENSYIRQSLNKK